MSTTQAILFLLPPLPDAERPDTDWWRVLEGQILESGCGSEWLRLLHESPAGASKAIALAPAALVRLVRSERSTNATPRQAATAARLAALESSLGDPETLHAVSAMVDDSTVVAAVTGDEIMHGWLDWALALGVDPDHIVPAAALVPVHDGWTISTLGSERLIGRHGQIMPYEADLVSQIVGAAAIEEANNDAVDAALAAAAAKPPLDLRTGKFARRRRIVFDRAQIRELAILASLIPVIALAWSLVSIAKLDFETRRLDRETISIAEAALGQKTVLQNAEAELAARFGTLAGAGFMSLLSATYAALQKEQSVSATEIAYRPDGTLSATFAAPALDAINRVLVDVQRNGYRVTAVPRQSPDGRAMVDTTIRASQ